MTFSERLAAAIAKSGHTQKSLADAVGMAQSSVWKLLSGAKGSRKTVAIAKELGVDPDWLSSGLGEMCKNSSIKLRDGVPASKVVGSPIQAWDSSDPLGDDEVEIPFYKSIELAAGAGRSKNQDYNGFKLRFSRATLRRYGIAPSDTAAFTVHGDSMAPVIPNGSTVMVDRGRTNIVDGGIYFIEQDDLFRIKLLYRQSGGKLIIRSYNTSEFPDEITDIGSVKVIGRVFNSSVMFL
ncbi:XRE family transcriptional regulator [Limnobaculum xujianqingii]|uniref:XRE family transcriptional regulator n=1 Tax=Limnobaculum xujianqingii TaxID=2738837 RepID=UPI001E2B4AAB|nr:helix-turn-helix transcriptional regulator [Limnobaculum xujianqingii]